MTRVARAINSVFVEEMRQGPPNHICKRLFVKDYSSDEFLEIGKTSTRVNYRNLLTQRIIEPKV